MLKSSKEIEALIEARQQGIHVDLGGGQYPQPGFLNIDNREVRGVDIVHDLLIFPWPLPDACASIAMCSHLIEHLNPMSSDPKLTGLIGLLLKKKLLTPKEVQEAIGDVDGKPNFIKFMDEVWRIMKPEGQFMITLPYAGSFGFWQDPTHINGCNEATWAYFDPMVPLDRANPSLGGLWNIYEPKPWKIEMNTWHANGNMEVILRKRPIQTKYLYTDPAPPKMAGSIARKVPDQGIDAFEGSLSKPTHAKA